ncbi:MAG: YbjN domain-containing protein [Candidatus Eisenbacteria sp.]|nr:YbjN domain-containing protein [Candidatus Eisenbacteria bacterium]
MAITMEQLQSHLRFYTRRLSDSCKERSTYCLNSDEDTAELYYKGDRTVFEVSISIQEGGNFLQLQSKEYLFCQTSDPHAPALFQALASANARTRLVKFAWDDRSGEIIASADTWLMDASISQYQFYRVLINYLSSLMRNYPRFRAILETGVAADSLDSPRVTEL